MAEEPFDPYYEWLGIPPDEQPANHYQLLGVRHFEDNPKVIENAADGRMLLLRSFQSGERAAASQEVLNKVAAAKVVLLDPERKTTYDAQLKAEQTEALAVLDTSPSPVEVGPSQQSLPNFVAPTPVNTSSPKTKRRKKRQANLPLLVLGGVAIVLFIATAFVVAQFSGGGTPDSTNQVAGDPAGVGPTSQPKAGSTDSTQRVPIERGVNPNGTKNSQAAPDPSTEADSTIERASPPSAKDDPAANARNQLPVAPAKPQPKPKLKPKLKPPPKKPQPAPLQAGKTPRLKQPSESTQAPFIKHLAEQLRVAEAREPAAKLSLLPGLFTIAANSLDATEKYVALRMGSNLALEANSPALAFEFIDRIAEKYQIDVAVEKLSALESVETPQTAVNRQVAILAMNSIEEAVAREKIELANRLSILASSAATRSRDKKVRDKSREARKYTQTVEAEFEKVRAARSTLKKNADDPTANLVVGVWECFRRDQWARGLPHLAKGDDSMLKTIAVADIAASDISGSSTNQQQAEIGDQWWDFAEQSEGYGSKAKARAVHWYRPTVLQLPAIDQRRTLNRLRELPIRMETAIQFSGRGSELICSYAPFDASPQFTLEFWVRNWNGILAMAGHQGDPENGLELFRRPDGGLLFWEHGKGSNREFKYQAPQIKDRFEHLAICYDRGILRIFHQGQLVHQSLKVAPGKLRSDRPFFIGCANRGKRRLDRGAGEIGLLRVSSVVRYARPFAPETAWNADADTLLLMNGSQSGGRMIDYSTKGNHSTQLNVTVRRLKSE